MAEIKWKEDRVFRNNPYNRDLYDIYKWLWRIEALTKLMKHAEKIGFSPNDGGDYHLYTGLHNDRAHFIMNVENFNDHEFVVKIWKDGSVHLYDRYEYVCHKCGKKGAEHLKRRPGTSCLDKPRYSHFRVNGKNRRYGH